MKQRLNEDAKSAVRFEFWPLLSVQFDTTLSSVWPLLVITSNAFSPPLICMDKVVYRNYWGLLGFRELICFLFLLLFFFKQYREQNIIKSIYVSMIGIVNRMWIFWGTEVKLDVFIFISGRIIRAENLNRIEKGLDCKRIENG